MNKRARMFAQALALVQDEVPDLEADYGAATRKVIDAHRRKVQSRLGAIRRQSSLVDVPVNGDGRSTRDRDPQVVHVTASELFMGDFDDELVAALRPRFEHHIGRLGEMLVAGYATSAFVPVLVAKQTNRLGMVGQSMLSRVDGTLTAAARDGLSFDGLADRIGSLFEGFSGWLADQLAGDEAAVTVNAVTAGAALWGGIEARRVWVTQDDERVREWHAEADGQEVALDEPFIVMGEPLDYPGDDNGSPENVRNCRCQIMIVNLDGTPIQGDAGVDDEALNMELDAADQSGVLN